MDRLFAIVEPAANISVVVFMVASLLDMGLKLKVQDALQGLRNVSFVVQTILWGFVLCPVLAWLLTKIISLDPAYATGLLLLGMTLAARKAPGG